MLKPLFIDDQQAEKFGVTPGWWAVDEIGTPVLGPHPSREGVLIHIGFSGREPAERADAGSPKEPSDASDRLTD